MIAVYEVIVQILAVCAVGFIVLVCLSTTSRK